MLAITKYLLKTARSRKAAASLLDEFDRKCASYARQPLMGDMRDELRLGLRSFVFKKWYVVIYRPLADGIVVLRVFDGRSDYGRFFDG